jgi:hypothetical protein
VRCGIVCLYLLAGCQAFAHAAQALSQIDPSPADDLSKLEKHKIDQLAPCGFFRPRGVRWQKKFNDGSALQVACDPDPGSILPGYHVWYLEPGHKRREIGRCIFDNGCNQGWYYTPAGSEDCCVLRVEWQNADGGRNDGSPRRIDRKHFTGPEEPYLDVVRWIYRPLTRRLEIVCDKHVYLLNMPRWPYNPKCEKMQPYIGPRVESLRRTYVEDYNP